MQIFNKKDIIIVAALALIALAAAFFFMGEKGNEAVIIFDSQTVKTVNLNIDGFFSVEEAPHVVFQVKDGGIGFIESDCPDKICIGAGVLSKEGETAACLPNRLVLRVKGAENAIDAVSK